MPLSFDPSSLMAPGGVVHGLDDLGSAVMNALNRRAERRYASDAAKAKAAADESQFTRQIQSRSDLQSQQDRAALEREQLQQTGRLANTGVAQLGETGRNLATNATRLLQTGMTTFGKMFSGKDSTSKDGIAEEKELNDTIIAINDQARREYPDVKPDQFARLMSPDPAAYDTQLGQAGKAVEAKREAFKLKRAAEHGLTYAGGRFSRGVPAAPAPTPKPAVAAQADAATAGSRDNAAPNAAKEAAWKRAEANGWDRAKFDAHWLKTRGN